MCFKYTALLDSPILRAAYSDRTAWLMAEMSKLSYIKFEDSQAKKEELQKSLLEADFNFVNAYDCNGTQAFLATRARDKMAVLAFRGTEKESFRDIKADLDARFYVSEKGVKVHNGFYRAFRCVESFIRKDIAQIEGYALYITGHSLGGALALIATRALNSDNLAACYTFGSPKVGNSEFGDSIKPPIYRVINSLDPVPCLPFTYLMDFFYFLANLLKIKALIPIIQKFRGYAHHGDMRFLTVCDAEFKNVRLIPNYSEIFRTARILAKWIKNRKIDADDHAIDFYCEKLGKYGLMRLDEPKVIFDKDASLPVDIEKEGGTMLKFFDNYEFHARVLPAIVLSLPIVFTCYIMLPEGHPLTKVSVSSIILLALVLLVSNIVRGLGKNIEPKLWKQWGGAPSTRFLRKEDTRIARETKECLYKKILDESKIDLINEINDNRIEQAFVFVRDALYRKNAPGLWIKSNKEYGWARNLLGSRLLIVLLSFACSLGCFFLIRFIPENAKNLLVGIFINALYGVIAIYYGWFVLPGLTKGIAERYAEQAIMAYIKMQ